MVMLLAAGAATWFYFFYATFGRVPHEAFMGRATAVRLTFQPYRIQRYISSLAPLGTRFIKGVPQLSSMQGGPIRINWIHRLPYEISLLLEEQAEDSLAAAFFVNVRPEPNDFMEALNESRLLHVLRFVQWRPYQVTPKAEGVLMTQGMVSIPQDTQSLVAAQWPAAKDLPPPPLSGKHLLELSADNGNGVLMQWLGALNTAYPRWCEDTLQQTLTQALPLVRHLSITGDLAKNDEVHFQVNVRCGEEAQPGMVEEAVNGAAEWLGDVLMEAHHFRFDGGAQWMDAHTLKGDYVLTGFEGALSRALGE